MITKPKNFASCYLYYQTNSEGNIVEKQLFEFLLTANRINYSSDAFRPVKDALRSRVNAAVLYRLLQQGGITLMIANKELPRSFKVFYAKDPKSGSKKRSIFLDVTGLIYEQGGQFFCKDIDKFSTYLLGVLCYYLYYNETDTLVRNATLQKSSAAAFSKMFCGILDYLRVSGFVENRERIQYITAVYFCVNVIGLDINTARRVAQAATRLSSGDAKASDYYYIMDDFQNIDTFVTSLAKTFKLKGITTGVLVDRWYFRYGAGTHFSLELYPAFLTTISFAYAGTYMNNWKGIEAACGRRDLVDLVTMLLKVGSEIINTGFTYESAGDRERYEKLAEAITPPQNNTNPKVDLSPKANDKPQQVPTNPHPQNNTPKPPVNNAPVNNHAEENKPVNNKPVDNNNNTMGNNANKPAPSNNQDNNKPEYNTKYTESGNLIEQLEEDYKDPQENTKKGFEYVERQFPDDKKEEKQFVDDILDDVKLPVKESEDDMADFDAIVKSSIENEDVPEAGEKDELLDAIEDDQSLEEGAKEVIKKSKDLKELYADWNEKSKNFVTHRWIERMITPTQEEMLSKWFDVMNAKDVSWSDYRKAFIQICKFMGLPNKGIILEWFRIEDDEKDKGSRKVAVRYSKGLATVKIPEGVQLVHVSPSSDIKELIPTFKSKTGGKFFYPSKRVFFTVDKEINRWDSNTIGKDTTKYVTAEHYTTAYIDPTYNTAEKRSVYIETDTPIKVIKQKDSIGRKIGNKVQDAFFTVTGANKLKKMKDDEESGITAPQKDIKDVKEEIEAKKKEKENKK